MKGDEPAPQHREEASADLQPLAELRRPREGAIGLGRREAAYRRERPPQRRLQLELQRVAAFRPAHPVELAQGGPQVLRGLEVGGARERPARRPLQVDDGALGLAGLREVVRQQLGLALGRLADRGRYPALLRAGRC